MDDIKSYHKAYREKNKEKIAAYQKKYQAWYKKTGKKEKVKNEIFYQDENIMQIELTGNVDGHRRGTGEYFTIDTKDYDLIKDYSWHKLSEGYIAATKVIDKKQESFLVHRLILGSVGYSVKTDHRNGNVLDNRRCNLRVCTNAENLRNSKPRKVYNGRRTSSQYKGVFYRKDTNEWEVAICVDSVQISIGSFKKEIEAAKAYNREAIKLHGLFARLNVIEEN